MHGISTFTAILINQWKQHGYVKINPGDFQEVDLADMFDKSENQSERLVHWQMTTLKFKSQMIFG